jgi:cation diffusion facilitator family transporter
VVAFLTVSAAVIAWQAVVNIRTPHQLPKPWTLWVLGAIIVWKEGSYRWVLGRARNTGSTALVAEAWHHRSDAITSVAAFIGIALARLLGPGHEAADDWAALLAAGFILYNAYKILRPALGEVMDEQTHHALIERIRAVAATVPGVRATEKCWVRKTGMKYHVDLHAHVDGGITVHQGHHIAHALQDALLRELPELGRVLVHIEPDGD